MTDDTLPAPVESALTAHDAFEPADGGFALSTTVFDTLVTATEAEGTRDGAFGITVTLPTLSAAVAGEEVAKVVEDDWLATFERRLADVFDVAHTDAHDEPTVERHLATGDVTVRLEYVARDAREGVEDAKALVEFVEGTYAQGLIPGYEYRGAAATLQSKAQQHGQEAAEGGGTPL